MRISPFKASVVLPLDMASSIFPIVIRVGIMAADSKYRFMPYFITVSWSPFPIASIMIKSSAREYTKDAAEPRATRVSILGAPCLKDPNPDVKNLPFMTMIIRARSISRSPRAT